MSPDSEFRVCLLIGDDEVQEWFVDALYEMLETTDTELELVVRVTDENKATSPDEGDVRSRLLARLFEPGKKALSEYVVRDPQSFVHIDGIRGLDDSTIQPCDSIKDGVRVRIPEDTIDRIDSTCDVIIHHGVGILTGRILEATTHGVIGFHHGDLRHYRGGPPGFWEFMHDYPEAGITVQRYTEELDAGEILVEKQLDISNIYSWEEIRRLQYSQSDDMLATAVRRLQDPEFDPVELSDDELGPAYYSSDRTTLVNIRYVLKELLYDLFY